MACKEVSRDAAGVAAPDNPGWIQLFNGRDLQGWQVKIRGHQKGNNFKNTFLVEDGILKVSYDQYDTFNNEYGHLFYERPFSYYRLRAEYRFVGEQVPEGPGWAFRNNGFMLHSQSAASMGLDQDFPISLEAQLLGGGESGERPTMNLCTPGSNVVVAGELIVLGDSIIHHLVEGDTVMTYSRPTIGGGDVHGYNPVHYLEGRLLTSGYIALQAESHPTEFRKIELLQLNKDGSIKSMQ
jgi:hypothetical protein